MARPIKQGLEYFPLDIGFFEDEKILAISGEFPVEGEIIAIRLLCEIYRNGYYAEYTLLLKNKISRLGGIDSSRIDEIVIRLVEYNFFNKSLFDSLNILTSKAIQERFVLASKRRANVRDLEYSLLNEVNVTITPLKPIVNATLTTSRESYCNNNVTLIPKGKEIKGKEIKDNTDVLLKDEKNDEFVNFDSGISDLENEPEFITETLEQSNYIYGAEFEKLKIQMLNENMWIDAVCMKSGQAAKLKSIFPEKLDEFFANAIAIGKSNIISDLEEAKRYFAFWINTNNNIKESNPNQFPVTMEELRREAINFKG